VESIIKNSLVSLNLFESDNSIQLNNCYCYSTSYFHQYNFTCFIFYYDTLKFVIMYYIIVLLKWCLWFGEAQR